LPQIYIVHYLEYQYKFSSTWALDSKWFWASLASWLIFFVSLFQSIKHTPIFFQQFFCYHEFLYSKHVYSNNFFIWNHHQGVSNVTYNKYFVVTLIWHLSMFVLGGGYNVETFLYKSIRPTISFVVFSNHWYIYVRAHVYIWIYISEYFFTIFLSVFILKWQPINNHDVYWYWFDEYHSL